MTRPRNGRGARLPRRSRCCTASDEVAVPASRGLAERWWGSPSDSRRCARPAWDASVRDLDAERTSVCSRSANHGQARGLEGSRSFGAFGNATNSATHFAAWLVPLCTNLLWGAGVAGRRHDPPAGSGGKCRPCRAEQKNHDKNCSHVHLVLRWVVLQITMIVTRKRRPFGINDSPLFSKGQEATARSGFDGIFMLSCESAATAECSAAFSRVGCRCKCSKKKRPGMSQVASFARCLVNIAARAAQECFIRPVGSSLPDRVLRVRRDGWGGRPMTQHAAPTWRGLPDIGRWRRGWCRARRRVARSS